MSDVEDYQTAVYACCVARMMLQHHDIPSIIKAIERAETMGPMLDPTLWQQKHKAMAQDKAILEAALPLWKLEMEDKA